MPRTHHVELSTIEDLVARALPRSTHSTVERVEEGASTAVYKVRRAGEVYYVRVLPEQGASFAPEARAHRLLRERGVKVPEVIYVDACDIMLGRSVMVTTEIAGQRVGHCRDGRGVRRVLMEAGRDLAAINSVPVDGFGWIRRHNGEDDHLAGEHRGYREFARDHLEDDLALLGAHTLDPHEVAAIHEVIERYDSLLDVEDARLAHGDFDATHIFQRAGRYTGIIDFGEIRGVDPFYDLRHFKLHDGETISAPVLPYLLEGYTSVAPLPPDYEQRIAVAALLIGVKALAHQLAKPPGAGSQPYIAWLLASIQANVKAL